MSCLCSSRRKVRQGLSQFTHKAGKGKRLAKGAISWSRHQLWHSSGTQLEIEGIKSTLISRKSAPPSQNPKLFFLLQLCAMGEPSDPEILPSTLPDSILPLFSVSQCSHIALGTQTLKSKCYPLCLVVWWKWGSSDMSLQPSPNMGEPELYLQLAQCLWGKMERWCCTNTNKSDLWWDWHGLWNELTFIFLCLSFPSVKLGYHHPLISEFKDLIMQSFQSTQMLRAAVKAQEGIL